MDGYGSQMNSNKPATPSVSVRSTQSLPMSSGLTMMSSMQQPSPMSPSQGMMMMSPSGGHVMGGMGMGGMQMMGPGPGQGMMMMHNPNGGGNMMSTSGMYQQQQPGMGMNMNMQSHAQPQGMMPQGSMTMGYPNNNNNMPTYGAPPLPTNAFPSF